MALRPSQLALRFDVPTAAPSRRWQDGALLPFLGGTLTLRLDTQVETAVHITADGNNELHLPLPPQATERQVQDTAEAWLRREAGDYFNALIELRSAQRGVAAPRLKFSFAARGGWTDIEAARGSGQAGAGCIKCNWRLIEQAPEIIEQVLTSALPGVHAGLATPDLFGSLAA